ncbi:MAG: hypothetical protein QXE52_07970 [Candidatus Caldarchaeum sp.]
MLQLFGDLMDAFASIRKYEYIPALNKARDEFYNAGNPYERYAALYTLHELKRPAMENEQTAMAWRKLMNAINESILKDLTGFYKENQKKKAPEQPASTEQKQPASTEQKQPASTEQKQPASTEQKQPASTEQQDSKPARQTAQSGGQGASKSMPSVYSLLVSPFALVVDMILLFNEVSGNTLDPMQLVGPALDNAVSSLKSLPNDQARKQEAQRIASTVKQAVMNAAKSNPEFRAWEKSIIDTVLQEVSAAVTPQAPQAKTSSHVENLRRLKAELALKHIQARLSEHTLSRLD